MAKTLMVEFFRGDDGDWYFRIKAGNGRELARSSEGYRQKRSAVRAASLILIDPVG